MFLSPLRGWNASSALGPGVAPLANDDRPSGAKEQFIHGLIQGGEFAG